MKQHAQIYDLKKDIGFGLTREEANNEQSIRIKLIIP